MPYQLLVSRFSFITFDETDTVSACNWDPAQLCLPVYAQGDIAFQFIISADTEEEADALCAIDDQVINIGTVAGCDEEITPFADTIVRYRANALQVSYYWPYGITTLSNYDINQCFRIGVEVFDQFFCSNCFIRIGDDCHTSVIEYGGDENAFGFLYCAGVAIDEDATDCDPLEILFTNQATMTIPWTAYLQSKFGTVPKITVWTYDGSELVIAGNVVKLDAYPPTELRFDFGGVNSGLVRIGK
jgi:hypothetical protein